MTPLVYAAAKGNYPTILLEKDKSGLNIMDERGSSALSYAVEGGFDVGVYLLLAQPSIDVNGPVNRARNDIPLLCAIERGYRAIARALILHPETKINGVSDSLTPPLIKAIRKHDEELVEFMILNRPDISLSSMHGSS
jgi:hypothetical protein